MSIESADPQQNNVSTSEIVHGHGREGKNEK